MDDLNMLIEGQLRTVSFNYSIDLLLLGRKNALDTQDEQAGQLNFRCYVNYINSLFL